MMSKKGAIHYEIIISLILGLIVLGLSLYFIFVEYFNEDELDWQQCRQSLVLRDMLPEKDLAVAVASSKGSLPLKCKTKVVNIDYEDLEKAEKEIAETISSCWYMVGEGDYTIFPRHAWDVGELNIPCMVCARIHLSEDVKDYYIEGKTIDIKRGLSGTLQGKDRTFWEYLSPDKGTRAFQYFKDWSEEGFSIDIHTEPSLISLRIPDEVESFNFPRYMDVDKGDLFIFYAQPTVKAPISSESAVKSYMVLVQYQNLDKIRDRWINFNVGGIGGYANVCSSIETIPA